MEDYILVISKVKNLTSIIKKKKNVFNIHRDFNLRLCYLISLISFDDRDINPGTAEIQVEIQTRGRS